MTSRLGPASILIAAAIALVHAPAAAQAPPPASTAPPLAGQPASAAPPPAEQPASAAPPPAEQPASAAPPLAPLASSAASTSSPVPPPPPMKRQDQDMFNGGIALLVAGGIGLVVGTALLVRTEGGLSLTREIGGAVAFSAAGLSFVAAVPLLVLGGKKVPATDAPVTMGATPGKPGSAPKPPVTVGLASVKLRF